TVSSHGWVFWLGFEKESGRWLRACYRRLDFRRNAGGRPLAQVSDCVAQRLQRVSRLEPKLRTSFGAVTIPKERGHLDRNIIERKGFAHPGHDFPEQPGARQGEAQR